MKIHSDPKALVVTIEAHDTPEHCAWLIDNMHLSKISQTKTKEVVFMSKIGDVR